MVKLILIVLCVLWGSLAQAATYYVATTGNNGNSCSAAQSESTPKLTIAAGVSCLTGGDTLIIKAGTYTAQEIKNPPAGTDSAYTVIMGDPSGARPVLLPDRAIFQRGLYCDNGSNCHHIELRHLEIRDGHNAIKLYGIDAIGYPHHLRIIDNYFYGGGVGILTDSSTTGYIGGDHLIQGNTFEQIGRLAPGYSPGVNSIYNPGSRTIIENNTFTHCQIGVGIWHSGDHTGTGAKWLRDIIVRNNIFKDMALPQTDTWQQGQGTPVGIHVSVPGGGHQIYNNLFYHSGQKDLTRSTTFYGIILNSLNTTGISIPINVYNNTFYEFLNLPSSNAVLVVAAKCSTSMCFIRNNIAYQAGGFLNGTQSNNLTANPSFTNAATYDLTLTSGSAAINAGTAVTGLPYCGSAPDIGAYETLVATAAAINGNTLDLTICTAKPPVVPGTFTVGCTGTGCGTPTVSSAATTGGGLVRLTISGITGGACAAGQTWTVSTSSTTTRSSSSIGFPTDQINQPLHTVTNFPVDSSACDGSGGSPPPASSNAEYNFENNLNDSSANANHAIGSSGISYAASRDGMGVQFTAGTNSYVDTGLLSGYNPSTNHLVVAFGVRVPANELGIRRIIAGVALGTNQRFYIRRDNTNVWHFTAQDNTLLQSEFPVVAGDQHICVKFNPNTDTATMYVNGVAGTVIGASVQDYTNYTFFSTLRFGLPSGFDLVSAGPDLIDQAFIYTTDVSCTDIYAAWNPVTAQSSIVQAGHRWQGVYKNYQGSVENRGALNAQRKIVEGGSAALVVQLNCTGGDCGTLQPRWRYNVNGGAFTNVVPDTATADGVTYWPRQADAGLNSGPTSGALTGALTHTDGNTHLSSAATPTITMDDDTSYTMRGLFKITSPVGSVVCFKIYDQGGQALTGYTPGEGACLTVIAKRASF